MAINLTINDNTGIKDALTRIEVSLGRIERTMALTKQEFDAKFAEFGTTLGELSSDLADLVGKVTTGGLTPAEQVDVFQKLSDGVDSLKGLAAKWTPDVPVEPSTEV